MNLERTFTSTILVAALSLAAAPAGAQQERNNAGARRGSGRTAAGAPAARQDRSVRAQPRQAPREAGRQSASTPAPRISRPPQVERAPGASANRSYAAQPPAPRAGQNQSAGDRRTGNGPRAVPRPSYQTPTLRDNGRRVQAPPRAGYRPYTAPRPYLYSRPYVRPYNYRPYRTFVFSRPYYSFRPHLSIGFGLWIGNPVPYPWAYLGSYRPRVYGYYPNGAYGYPNDAYGYSNGAYGATPSVSIYGGVSFDIQPSDADLFVDGEYAGPVGAFSPNTEPLTLAPGEHRIALQREGFRPMEWVVVVEPGQVIPYRGNLERD